MADRDRYGRLIAEVRLRDGRSLNRELVRAGYAWRFRRYSRNLVLATLEAEASARTHTKSHPGTTGRRGPTFVSWAVDGDR